MRYFSAVALLFTIAASISIMFVTAKWATSVPEVLMFLLGGLWAVAIALGRTRPRLALVLAPLCSLIVLGLLQVGFGVSVYAWQTWLSLIYWTCNLAVLFVGLQIFADEDLRERFLRWLAILGFVVSAFSALQALTTNQKIYWIFSTEFAGWNLLGPFVYHNQFAAFVELVLPIALYGTLTDRRWRAIYALAAATMYAAVIVAASRMGFVLTTAEMVLVPLVAMRQGESRNTVVRWAGGLLVTVVVLTLAAGPEILTQRFAIKDPYAVRREFMLSSLSMMREKPLTGLGLGTWPTAYPAYALFDDGRFANQAHNDWAQWAVEGGAPGILIMLALVCLTVPRAVRSGWGMGVAAIFLHCLVDYPIQRTAVALVFFAVMSATVRTRGSAAAGVVPIRSKVGRTRELRASVTEKT